jgi:RNA polymerase sigma factor (sigma-70 family)
MIRSLRSRGSPDRTVESLYRDYAADVYRYALAVLGSPADAEDVTQATFLNAFRAIERGERPRQPGAWLRVIAHNLCLQQFRQMSRRPQQVELDEDAGELVGDDDAPTLEDLIRGLKQVPFNQRAALVMREFEDRSIAEIAAILSLSVSAVETLLFRARRSLREQLEENLTCIEAEHAISRQLDGLLPRRDRGPLRAHLRECKACASHARRLRAQRSSMRTLGVVPLPAALAWSHVGGGAAGTTAGVAASAGASAGAPIGVSIGAKLAAAALAASAIGGVGYVGVSQHLFNAPGARTVSPPHMGARANAANARTASRRASPRISAQRTRVHHAPPSSRDGLAPATIAHPAPQRSVVNPSAPAKTAPAHANKPASVPKQHVNAQPPSKAPKRPAPQHKTHRPKPHKQAPIAPPVASGPKSKPGDASGPLVVSP